MKSDWQYSPRPVARTSGVNCLASGATGIVLVLLGDSVRFAPVQLASASIWCCIGVAMIVLAPTLSRPAYLTMHLVGLTSVTAFVVVAGTTTAAISGMMLQVLLVTPAFVVLPNRTARVTTFLNAGYVLLLGLSVGEVPLALTINTLLVVFALAISSAWVQSVASKAEVDELTKLANRRRMQRELNPEPGARVGDELRTIAVVDIDDFKTINDALGHAEGDRVLTETAVALRAQLPRKWIVARSGGDEFAVMSARATVTEMADAIDRVRRVLGDRWTISVGIAGRHVGESAQDTRDRADRALYRSKAGGRNRTTVDSDDRLVSE